MNESLGPNLISSVIKVALLLLPSLYLWTPQGTVIYRTVKYNLCSNLWKSSQARTDKLSQCTPPFHKQPSSLWTELRLSVPAFVHFAHKRHQRSQFFRPANIAFLILIVWAQRHKNLLKETQVCWPPTSVLNHKVPHPSADFSDIERKITGCENKRWWDGSVSTATACKRVLPFGSW